LTNFCLYFGTDGVYSVQYLATNKCLIILENKLKKHNIMIQLLVYIG
jgi:hypothetical protein